MKTCFLISIILFFSVASNAQNGTIPKEYVLIDSAKGDLDNDGIEEMAFVFNTRSSDVDDKNIPRALIICKWKYNSWRIWHRSLTAIYGSKQGGMMGDPYEEIKIEKGILSISQSGGSSWKWWHTDKYRFQDGMFYLIGYTSYYGKLCEYWTKVDFNLSTGKVIYTNEYEKCENQEQEVYKTENETFYKKDLKITLHDRNVKDIYFQSPKNKFDVYVAVKLEDE